MISGEGILTLGADGSGWELTGWPGAGIGRCKSVSNCRLRTPLALLGRMREIPVLGLSESGRSGVWFGDRWRSLFSVGLRGFGWLWVCVGLSGILKLCASAPGYTMPKTRPACNSRPVSNSRPSVIHPVCSSHRIKLHVRAVHTTLPTDTTATTRQVPKHGKHHTSKHFQTLPNTPNTSKHSKHSKHS